MLLSRRNEDSIIQSKSNLAFVRNNEIKNINSDKSNPRLSQEPIIGISSSKNISQKDIINLSETNLDKINKSMNNVFKKMIQLSH